MARNRQIITVKGRKFHNGKGVVREVTSVDTGDGYAQNRVVHWMTLHGEGPDEGSSKWSSWLKWVEDEWFEPRPDRLPVPESTPTDRVFSTSKCTPPWRWVPDEFRNQPSGFYENRQNPWVQLVHDIFGGVRQWSDWQAIPKEGIDPQKAFNAVDVALRNWGQKHEQKLATCGWMLSEWFEDFWFKGDTHTAIHKHNTPQAIESRLSCLK